MPLPPQAQLRRYRVTTNRPIAEGVFQLLLEPVADPIPPHKSGQWVSLHLLNPDGSVWAKAAYSIANAPPVTGPLELGIKVAGDFTQRARLLKTGDEVLLQGPWGVFVLQTDLPRLVMFAGGIGITPLLSMAREACGTAMSSDVLLFYSSRTCRESAYLDELRGLAKRCPRFRLVEICTRETHPPSAEPVPSGAEGLGAGSEGKETGRIDAAMLDRYIQDYSVGEYSMCGPKDFMDNIKQLLQNKGVEVKKIRHELF